MFDKRANSMELLDKEDMDENFAFQSYRFMSMVNRYFGGTAIVKNFIKREIRLRKNVDTLKILDIGAGACDIPASICEWAKTRPINLEFSCVETNPYAINLAKQNIRNHHNIKLIQEDIFKYQAGQRYDCAIGSLFFHHLTDEQIGQLISKLHAFGCGSILINDLHRSFLCYAGCLIASLFISADVRHDALLSIRKGFKPSQLYEIMQRIPKTRTTVSTAWFARVYAIIRFTEDGV